MRRIAVALSKGGVGKSTTAATLAFGLSRLDEKVLLIDADTQGQCSNMLGVKPSKGLAELLDGADPGDVLTEARPKLWLLAGERALNEAKTLMMRKMYGVETVLSEALAVYDGQFDYVLIDTAPGWDVMSINVLFYADEILCPVSVEALAVDGFLKFLRSVEPVQQRKAIELAYILPTFVDGRIKRSEEIFELLSSRFAERVCEPIRYSVKLSECPAHGQIIFEYAPRDRATRDYSALTVRVRNGKKTDS